MRGPGQPPRARTNRAELEAHGHLRVDPYFWLNQRDNPEVLSYLQAENAFTEAAMARTADLQDTLFREIVSRIDPDDASVPYWKAGYYHYHRFREGEEYAIHCRRKGSLEAPEEILLDGNQLAKGQDYFSLVFSDLSPDQRLAAYAIDTVGRRIHTLRFKDLETGAVLEDLVPSVTGSAAFSADGRTVFYTKQHPDTLRSYQVFRHRLGTDPGDDVLVYEEKDETFYLRLSRTRSEKFLVVVSIHALTTEYRVLEADRPEAEFRVLVPREHGHKYSARHHGEHFFFLSNKAAPGFRLARAPSSDPSIENWEEVVPHREGVILEDLELFRDFLALVERREGRRIIRVLRWDGASEHEIVFDEPVYSVELRDNHHPDTDLLRFAYGSFATPPSIYDYDMRSRERRLLKRDRAGEGFDPADYSSAWLFAEAADGEQVPVSLVHRRDLTEPGRAPLLLYGYGAYGLIHDPRFSPEMVSLLDRGFVFAIAHVRGGSILGRRWYDAGRMFEKKNTFTDYIACAEMLVEKGYGDREKVFALGASAGGLLVGAVLNLRPDLFLGAVAHVPFVDVVTTMLDESLPLTTSEYEEWGDPRVREQYEYILSYSPYDNVTPTEYPHLLVTAGLHDSQVPYWEAAKWIAKLRAMKTDERLLLLKTNLDAGHHGATGRYRRHRETALDYAFLLEVLERL
jgi:oligopeptidase B